MPTQTNPYRAIPKIRVPIRNIADYSPFGVQLDGRTISGDSYRYGYQGSEKDDESKGGGNSYVTHYRMLDPRLGRWLSLDPVFQPWQSPYSSMDNNPIRYNDVFGNVVDPTSSGYEAAKKAATPIYKKDGVTIDEKKSKKNGYESEFAKIFNEMDQNQDILVQFKDQSGYGSIAFTGKTDDGKKIYEAHWDPSWTKEMGTSGLFEEAFHLNEALKGVDMKFSEAPNTGVMGVDINDEVRAKMWVAKNINISKKYTTDSELKDDMGFPKKHSWSTHYGYIATLSDAKSVENFLRSGFREYSTIAPPIGTMGSSETSFRDVVTGDSYKDKKQFPDGDRKP